MSQNVNFFGSNGLTTLLMKMKDLLSNYVSKEHKTGSTTVYKVLSDNNLTDDLVKKINNAGTSSFSGSYTDLTNKPTIPSKVSELTNDSKYQTDTQVSLAINTAVSGMSSTAYVDQKIAALVADAPEALDTLKEIADALADSDSDISGLVTEVNKKLNTSDVVEMTAADVTAIWDTVFVTA